MPLKQLSPQPRLFFALWPDAALRRELEKVAGCTADAAGRKVNPENFHLTLLFLGATPAERIPALMEAAGKLEIPSFDLSIEHGGWWKRSGILWLAPARTPAALQALAEALAGAARAQGLDVRLGDFRPHISLRRKVRSPPAVPAFAPLAWQARDFLLLESVTRAEGPEYRVLGCWPLGKEVSE